MATSGSSDADNARDHEDNANEMEFAQLLTETVVECDRVDEGSER